MADSCINVSTFEFGEVNTDYLKNDIYKVIQELINRYR